jgi:hypothetical protein
MNIKSLLIGSAAALATVSGAYAADAVVAAEPEPMEYVRVCDAYGAGFFYIPGTETCLAIGGYVWYQVGTSNYDSTNLGNDSGTEHGIGYTAVGTGWHKNIRARVNFDARTETEWGTLRSYIRLQAGWNGVGDGAVGVDQAYIQLGGLDLGYSESFWVDDHISGAMNYGSHSWSGLSYGYQQRARIGYRFKGGNGFFGVIALEDDNLTGNGYLPDVVAKVGVQQDWGWVAAAVAYDESAASWAGKLGAQINIPNMPGSSFRVIGMYSSSGGALAAKNAYGFAPWQPNITHADWSVIASYNQQFNEKFGASVGFQYWGGIDSLGVQDFTGWEAELSGVYMATPNLELRGEVAYRHLNVAGTNDGVSGYLRVTRYF